MYSAIPENKSSYHGPVPTPSPTMAAELDQFTDTKSLQGGGLTGLERMMEMESKYQVCGNPS